MKILLVDDERGFLDVMGDILRENGHEVIVAENGKHARESLEFEQIDVIISDVFMPTLDGLRFHDYVREFTAVQDIPFIFMSGYDDEHTQRTRRGSLHRFFPEQNRSHREFARSCGDA